MVVCRYFQQGCCRFGASCRFEHIYGQKYTYSAPQPANTSVASNTEQLVNQVVSDINNALKSGQWLMSCYGPFNAKPNMPGLDDICPEEMRLATYEARINGTLDSTNCHITNYCKNFMDKLKHLTKPKPAFNFVNVIECLHKGEIPSDPFATMDLGNSSPSISIFSSNIAPQGSTNNIFGSQNAGASTNNIFANAAKALFQDTSNNMFGAQTSQFGTSNSPFLPQVDPSVNTSPFSGFNQNTTGINFNQNLFYNAANNMNNPSSQVFGDQNINTPQPNQMFGQPPQETVSASALFGAANAKLQQNQTLPQNVFGQTNNFSVSDKNGNPFQVPSQSSSPFTQTIPTSVLGNNPFINNVSNQNSVFQNDTSEEVYSNHAILTEQDVSAFQSNTFQHGFIPEIAPSKELCR